MRAIKKMKILFILFGYTILCINGMNVSQRPVFIEPFNRDNIAMLFSQTLDHYSGGPSTNWNQRYWYSKQFVYSTNHPNFLLINGEKASDPGWLNGGQWNSWASKVGAMMYILEHRYYGQSRPTIDLSTDNLQYLTSDQALADIKNFIETMNAQNGYTSANKWILFGGSYAGSLAAWSRLHFPNLVTGAVSSGAPLQAQANFPQYRDPGVRFSLNYFSPGCADSLHQSILAVQSLLESGSNDDKKVLTSKFKFCTFPTSRQDKIMFYQHLVDSISNYVQNNNEEFDPLHSISYICQTLNNQQLAPIDRLAQYKISDNDGCAWTYKQDVESMKNTKYIDNDEFRQWFYQLCNEFGDFQTSETRDSLMSDTMPYDFYTQKCSDVFGPKFNADHLNRAAAYTNIKNKGWNIQTTNIVFLQGNIDPWHYLGAIRHPSASMPYVLINGTAHMYDMLNWQSRDPLSVVNARNFALQNIIKWVT